MEGRKLFLTTIAVLAVAGAAALGWRCNSDGGGGSSLVPNPADQAIGANADADGRSGAAGFPVRHLRG